ncbi:MAG TPA: carboxylesterase family protein [Desulfomonilia bacterium]
MTLKNTFFLIIAAALILCGCRVSGKVAMDGAGLKGIPIVLQGDAYMEALTGEDGRFVFSNVKAGAYTVTLKPVAGWTREVTKAVTKKYDFADVTGVDFSISSASLRQTSSGEVIGFTEDNGCHAWLGIPYAKAPVGELRWRAPQPAEGWTGKWLALQLGSVCTQFAGLISDVPREMYDKPIGCEDCLFMNIWAPAFDPSHLPEGSDRLPVMMWIHGGGNTIGHGGQYNGKMLAEKYGVIVVSINYRLGPFGWFAHPALRGDGTTPLDRSGNYGTLDIIRALSWIGENISNFGGDPGNVTIFGESAGGQDVLTMMLSPQAKGLFHKAVVESGGLGSSTMAQAENYSDDVVPGDDFSSREVINRLLIADGTAPDRTAAKAYQDAMSDDAIEKYLRGRNNYAILNQYKAGYGGMITMPKVFEDGVVMPQGNYLDLLKDTATYNPVPVIIGSNRDEYKLFMIMNPDYVDIIFGLPLHVKNQRLYDLTASYMSDRWKAVGVDEIASALSIAQPGQVWAYRFDWDEEPSILGIDVASLAGACHSMEIAFVFSDFSEFISPLFTSLLYNKSNEAGRTALSGSMSSYWVEFARNGSPGKGTSGTGLEWKPWNQDSPMADKFIVFDTPDGGGIGMSSNIVTMQALKYRLLAETGFPTQKDHCRMYVSLFAGTGLWDDWEYEHLGKIGCGSYPPEGF